MVVFKSGETQGMVAYVKDGQVFRFVRTPVGDIFVPPSLVCDQAEELVQGAEVKLSYKSSDRGLVATKFASILPPASQQFHLGIVKFFNGTKGYGFIENTKFGAKDVFVHKAICVRSGLELVGEMSVEFTVEDVDGKLRATAVRLVEAKKRSAAKPKKSAKKPAEKQARGKRRTTSPSEAEMVA